MVIYMPSNQKGGFYMNIIENSKQNFVDFLYDFNLTDEQENELIEKYDNILNSDISYYKELDKYISDCDENDEYNYDKLVEILDAMLEEIEMEHEKDKVIITNTTEEINNEEKIENKLNEDDLGDEDITIVENKKLSNLKAKLKVKKENKIKNNDLGDEDIIIVENKSKKQINDLGDEDIAIVEKEVEVKNDLGNIDIPVEEKEPKKENRIVLFFKDLFKKKEISNDLGDEDIAIADVKKPNSKFVVKKQKPVTKIEEIEKSVNEKYADNNEILDFITFIKFRDDKTNIIDELYDYVKYDDFNNEEKFLDKLYEIFGITKNEEKSVSEQPTIKVEPKIEVEKTVEEIKEPTEEKEMVKVEITLNDKYTEVKDSIFNELNDQEKIFVEDMIAEGLQPGDIELDQMLNERKVNKANIYKYLLKIEKIKLLNAYENLGEFEKEFVNEATEENINFHDAEFNQMLNERCVNRKALNNYYSLLEKSYNYQKLIADDYKKHIKFENSIDLENKKVKELKEIAKERKISNISKLKKDELIEALNKLTQLKYEEADKQLGLMK